MAYVAPKICPVIGIDLGTTNSCVGVWRQQRFNCGVDIVADPTSGQRTIPSVVYFPNLVKKNCVVGGLAVDMIVETPSQCAYDMKRLIGKDFDDPMVMKLGQHIKLVRDSKTNLLLAQFCFEDTDNRRLRPLDVSALVLMRLKNIATDALNSSASPIRIEKAVIGVPAHFTQRQKSETLEAARLAGMEATLITEPVAAAYAFGCYHERYNNLCLLVFDLGGGTFDTSVIKVEKGEFHVLALGGDAQLGGRDFDLALLEFCRAEMLRLHSWDCCATSAERQRMLLKCEQAKKALSVHQAVNVQFGDMRAGMMGKPLNITRARFEALIAPMVSRALYIVEKTIAEANDGNAESAKLAITEVLLVGGSTCIPLVQRKLSALFGHLKGKLNQSINGEEVVAYGATVRAAQLWGKAGDTLPPLSIFDITALSIGVGQGDENPALDCFTVIIPRGSPIPFTNGYRFRTTANGQTTMSFAIYEGERRLSMDNIHLKTVELNNLPHARAGDVGASVYLQIDQNGQLWVFVFEENSGSNQVTACIDYKSVRAVGQSVEDMLASATLNDASDSQKAERFSAMTAFEMDIERFKWGMDRSGKQLHDLRKAEEACDKYRQWIFSKGPSSTVQEIKQAHQHFRDKYF